MRAVNRVGAALLGLILLVAGLLVAVDVALLAGGRRPWLLPMDRWHAPLSTTTVGDPWVLAISIAVGVVGLAVLVAQLRPWPPHRLLAGDERDGVWWLSRPSVERRVVAAADAVTGVDNAHASVRGRERHWRVRMRVLAMPDRGEAVRQAVRAELNRLSAPADIPVRISLQRPRRLA